MLDGASWSSIPVALPPVPTVTAVALEEDVGFDGAALLS